MFHELFASGPPWRSSFWTSPLQRSIAARLAVLSDKCRTNQSRCACTLERLAPRHRGRIVVQPVFSNVGELDSPPPIETRPPWMVAFGSGTWIGASVTEHREELARACRSLGINKVLVIGDYRRDIPEFPFAIQALGLLSPDVASGWMRQAQAGFTSCPVHCLGKSGIFAAYAAHGMLPVVAGPGVNDDGLVLGKNTADATSLSSQVSFEEIVRISVRAHAWYLPHNVRETASSYYEQLVGRKNELEPASSR